MSDPFSNHSDPFMDNLGGSSSPSVSFPEIGASVTGVVNKVDERADTFPDGTPKTWPSGDPMNVYVFNLTTDDGDVSLWVRGNMVTAIREASRAAGITTVIGQQLTVQHHALGEKKPGKFPAKLFRAKFEPAPVRAARAAVSAADESW